MKEEDDIRKRLKVIQGKRPSINHMKNKLPKRFQELKIRLAKVADLDWLILNDAIKKVAEYITIYGNHLERIYFEKNEVIEDVYDDINKLMSVVEKAEKSKARDNNIGKEPGE